MQEKAEQQEIEKLKFEMQVLKKDNAKLEKLVETLSEKVQKLSEKLEQLERKEKTTSASFLAPSMSKGVFDSTMPVQGSKRQEPDNENQSASKLTF